MKRKGEAQRSPEQYRGDLKRHRDGPQSMEELNIDLLAVLPGEVIQLVTGYCSLPELGSATLVSKAWRSNIMSFSHFGATAKAFAVIDTIPCHNWKQEEKLGKELLGILHSKLDERNSKIECGIAERRRLELCEVLQSNSESSEDAALKADLLSALCRVRITSLDVLPPWKLASPPEGARALFWQVDTTQLQFFLADGPLKRFSLALHAKNFLYELEDGCPPLHIDHELTCADVGRTLKNTHWLFGLTASSSASSSETRAKDPTLSLFDSWDTLPIQDQIEKWNQDNWEGLLGLKDRYSILAFMSLLFWVMGAPPEAFPGVVRYQHQMIDNFTSGHERDFACAACGQTPPTDPPPIRCASCLSLNAPRYCSDECAKKNSAHLATECTHGWLLTLAPHEVEPFKSAFAFEYYHFKNQYRCWCAHPTRVVPHPYLKDNNKN